MKKKHALCVTVLAKSWFCYNLPSFPTIHSIKQKVIDKTVTGGLLIHGLMVLKIKTSHLPTHRLKEDMELRELLRKEEKIKEFQVLGSSTTHTVTSLTSFRNAYREWISRPNIHDN